MYIYISYLNVCIYIHVYILYDECSEDVREKYAMRN